MQAGEFTGFTEITDISRIFLRLLKWKELAKSTNKRASGILFFALLCFSQFPIKRRRTKCLATNKKNKAEKFCKTGKKQPAHKEMITMQNYASRILWLAINFALQLRKNSIFLTIDDLGKLMDWMVFSWYKIDGGNLSSFLNKDRNWSLVSYALLCIMQIWLFTLLQC